MLLLIPKRLFLVVLPDFHTAYLTADGLGKFVDELYDTGVFVRSGHFLYVVLQLLDQLLAGAVLIVFGQYETTLTVATMPWMQPKPGSMGLPNPQYDVDMIDHDGRSVEAGEQGQIVIRTDKGKPLGLFKEYYRDANRTREAWHDNIYYTGDVAWKDEDGYLWFVGRADDVIKSSGYRIGPFEVESALMTHPAVIECAITGVPDEIGRAHV